MYLYEDALEGAQEENTFSQLKIFLFFFEKARLIMMKMIAVVLVLSVILLTNVSTAIAGLEQPADGSTESGIGVIRGWDCRASEGVRISIEAQNGQFSITKEALPLTRSDVSRAGLCDGDPDVGYSVPLFNWNLLGPGLYTVKAELMTSGDEIGRSTIRIAVPREKEPFIHGLSFCSHVNGNGLVPGEVSTFCWDTTSQSMTFQGSLPSDSAIYADVGQQRYAIITAGSKAIIFDTSDEMSAVVVEARRGAIVEGWTSLHNGKLFLLSEDANDRFSIQVYDIATKETRYFDSVDACPLERVAAQHQDGGTRFLVVQACKDSYVSEISFDSADGRVSLSRNSLKQGEIPEESLFEDYHIIR